MQGAERINSAGYDRINSYEPNQTDLVHSLLGTSIFCLTGIRRDVNRIQSVFSQAWSI